MFTFYPNPVLQSYSLDYKNPDSYVSEIVRVSKELIVTTHRLDQGNLVAEFVKDNKASFFTTVVVNRVFYRKTFITNINEVIEGNQIVVEQKIELPKLSSIPTIYVHAGIVNKKETIERKWDENTGISRLAVSDNHSYNFPSLCLLASGGWRKYLNLQALFTINPDPSIEEGEFKTDVISEDFSLKIKISMNPRMAATINSEKDNRSRSQILSTALTHALQELRDLYEYKKENELLNAASDLENWLLNKVNITWESDGFNSSLTSSKLWPVIDYQQT